MHPAEKGESMKKRIVLLNLLFSFELCPATVEVLRRLLGVDILLFSFELCFAKEAYGRGRVLTSNLLFSFELCDIYVVGTPAVDGHLLAIFF